MSGAQQGFRGWAGRCLAILLIGLAGPALAKPAALAIEAVSNRADLVSGGDVLVRVSLPSPADATDTVLALNGTPLATTLHPAPDGKGFLTLVAGLAGGKNELSVTVGRRTARLTVTNHPNGGPLFSGPQIQPWTCRAGATNAQCDRPAAVSYSYMPSGATAFRPFDPAVQHRDLTTITTPEGVTLPYIVRVESFTQNRSGVSVAVLFQPGQTWTPWSPQKQWNKGVFVLQGAGCGTSYTDQPAGNPLNDNALRKGFAVVTVALLHNTINCNPVVQAEAAIMAKEHVAETYGPFDLIFGMGGSGGAISQIMDQNAYPGIYDGLILNHLFADSDASRKAAYDCRLVYDYWARPGTIPYTDAQKSAVVGMLSGCASSPTRFDIYNPSVGTGCDIPAAQRFNAQTNPRGVRCSLQDYEVNQIGRRPDGKAHGRLDTVGVQFGLMALKAGTITPAQFVEMNAAIGGHDIDFNRLSTRTVADRGGLRALYATGINNGANNLSETAIIETRVLANDFHQVFHAVQVRARLDRAQGHHDNYALWRSTASSDPSFASAFDVMTAWIKAIRADARDVPKARKVVDNRPATARDRCTLGDGKDQPLNACPRPPELVRVLAGAPDANDTGKCRLKRLNRADYAPAAFRPEQWASLQATFPSGVCDYSKPLVDFGYTRPWLAYSGDGRYAPLPPAPKSR